MNEELIIVDKTDLTDIADAIRSQTGEEEPMSIKAMSPKIRTLSASAPAVQSDWNQNDSEAADYVKNRTHWVDESGYHTLDENFIPDTIARASEVNEAVDKCQEDIETLQADVEAIKNTKIQPDWNQNDSEAVDYIKNRTHWIEGANVVALPQTELLVNKGNVDLYEVPVEGLTPNAHCVVTIDGVSYETTATQGVFNAYEWYIIGNAELVGEDSNGSDLPFGIFVDKYNENYMQLSDSSKSGTVQVKIEVVSEVVHKIPDIYLPATVGVAGTGGYSEIFNDLAQNKASGDYSHAENFKTTASGYGAHAEGIGAIASGYGSHAENASTLAKGAYAHAEGYYTEANGSQSHTEGSGTIANGKDQHVSGSYNVVDSASLVIVGNGSANNQRSNAYRLTKDGHGYFTGDVYANNKKLATEELVNTKPGEIVTGKTFTVDGEEKTAAACAEIYGDLDTNIAIGQWSHAEGSGTRAIGKATHAEGAYSQAITDGTHVEGYGTKATGYWSHAEGEYTIVSSYASHAEGSYCTMPDGTKRYSTAAGYASHTEGGGCHTTGVAAHAEGIGTTASGRCAHVEGIYTVAAGQAQHAEGVANIEDTENKYIHIAGNGTLPTNRSNAYTLDWDGNGWFAGSVEATAIILTSPNGTRFKITVTDTGELVTSAI